MSTAVRATPPLKDYSFVRGVCYDLVDDQATLEKELGYAQRLRLNSTRIWLDYRRYTENPPLYTSKLVNYVRTARRFGITTMPVLFNGNGLDPAMLRKEFWATGDSYVNGIVCALKNEPGLLIWDVMNEPLFNDYIGQAPPAEYQKRREEVGNFLRHYCALVKQLDPSNAITVGHTVAEEIPLAGALVDVISFHDYSSTRQGIEHSYAVAEGFSEKFNKPLINSELGCIGRANPYDAALEICENHRAGWYVFNLIIRGFWSDIHGLCYPDGTIRDPSAIAAIYGFRRNRDLRTVVKPKPNRENAATKAVAAVKRALEEGAMPLSGQPAPTNSILDAAEVCANLLEASEMIPMEQLPSAKIRAWRATPEPQRNVQDIRAFADQLAMTLQRECRIP